MRGNTKLRLVHGAHASVDVTASHVTASRDVDYIDSCALRGWYTRYAARLNVPAARADYRRLARMLARLRESSGMRPACERVALVSGGGWTSSNGSSSFEAAIGRLGFSVQRLNATWPQSHRGSATVFELHMIVQIATLAASHQPADIVAVSDSPASVAHVVQAYAHQMPSARVRIVNVSEQPSWPCDGNAVQIIDFDGEPIAAGSRAAVHGVPGIRRCTDARVSPI